MVDNATEGAMGEKITEETVELYEMLGANSQQKSERGRRVGVNKVKVDNGMTTQLTELTRQVALLNSCAQPNNEFCEIYGVFSHGANMCPQSLYELEQINYTNTN